MKRRTFIIKSGLAGSGLMLGASVLPAKAFKISPNDTVNFGVIGTGSRGKGLISLLKRIDGARVTACCDVLPFRLEEGLKRAGKKAKGYTDYRKLLDDKNVDAVIVATPFSTHAQIDIDALDAGKHVYGEKTMAKGMDGIKALVDKVATSKTIFQTGHQYHSSRLYMHVVDMIKNGVIGEVSLFECQWNRNGNWRRSVPDPSLERQINWRMYREFSGGLAAELSSHQIDFVSWVLGENPKKIMGAGGINYWKDGRETYDNINLLYEYPGGAKAKYTCLTNNSLGDYQILVHGSKGTIQLDYTKAWITFEHGHEKKLEDVDGVSGATSDPHLQGKGRQINFSHEDPTKQALIDFRESILSNKTPLSDVHTGARTAAAVQLSLDAMYNNEIVYWKKAYDF